MDNSQIISPTPQRAIPVAAIQAEATNASAEQHMLTADKLAWLYASLSVLKRHERITKEESLRIQLQRKHLLQLATRDLE